MSYDNFLVKQGCQTQHAYSRTEQIIARYKQMHTMSDVGTPARNS